MPKTYRRPTTRVNGRPVVVARAVVEKALGRALSPENIVHHFDGNPYNNSPENLVVCPDKLYHELLHIRQESLEATGNPELRKCYICKKYDSVFALKKYTSSRTPGGFFVHAECNRQKSRAYYQSKVKV